MKKLILQLARTFGVDLVRIEYRDVVKEVIKEVTVPIIEYVSLNGEINGNCTVTGNLIVNGCLYVNGEVTCYKIKGE